MMKNRVFFTILLLLTVCAFAQNIPDVQNRYLFIEGTSSRGDLLEFFKSGFSMEASGLGYTVTQTRNEAAHTLKFAIASDNDPDYESYVISISLNRNETNANLISFDFPFASLDEAQPFIRTLFLNSVSSIPLPLLNEENLELARGNHWNKWVYIRMSFDFPVTLYRLQPEGLRGGMGLFRIDPSTGKEASVSPISLAERTALPGATLGIELQLLNFMCLEFDYQLYMGDTRNDIFINMEAGAELKFPIKFRNVMLVPYGAFSIPLNVSPVFVKELFPPFAVGGGIQVCARVGKRGIIFVDTQYTTCLSDAVMYNPYLSFPELWPEPGIIHYKRSQIGIGIGYKVGILDRAKKTATFTY